MYESPRIKFYTSAVAFPATKTAGVLTITGTSLYDFESYAYGSVELVLRALDKSKITDTLTAKISVSYDGGTTWIVTGAYTELANGSGAVSVYKAPILYAPRVRVDAIFDATGALASGHGCGVDAKVSEANPFYRHNIFTNVVTVPATKTAGALTYTGATKYIANTIDPLRKLVAVASATDLSKITNGFTWKVQSSFDGTNWFDATTAQSGLAAGTGTYFTEVEVTTKLGKYARILLISDGTGALASGHGIAFQLIALDF